MAITKAVAYLKDAVKLNEVAKDALLTIDLEARQVKFTGANTVELPVIKYSYLDASEEEQDLTTFSTYSRTTGFVPAILNLEWDTFTLTQDKGNSLKLDAMDDEEGLGASIIPFAEQYIRTLEVPAVDTYRLKQLVLGSGNFKDELDGGTGAKMVGLLIDAFATLREDEFADEGLILYVSTTTDSLLQNNALLKQYIRVDEFTTGGVKTKIRYFNNAKIVVIPSGRWPKNFGGAADLTIYFILLHPTAQLSVIKHRPAHYYKQGSVAGFDGSQIDMRLYHDIFVLDERKKGIYVAVKEEVHTVTFNSKGGSAVANAWVKDDGKITKPTDPVKEGYTFTSWQTTDGGDTAWVFATGEVTADMTLYAKWTADNV